MCGAFSLLTRQNAIYRATSQVTLMDDVVAWRHGHWGTPERGALRGEAGVRAHRAEPLRGALWATGHRVRRVGEGFQRGHRNS
jgi:hypothetical protein